MNSDRPRDPIARPPATDEGMNASAAPLRLAAIAPPAAPTATFQDARVSAVLAGDRRAAESIVRELLPRVRNLVRYLVRRDADVDDVAQQACIEILRSLGSWRGEASLTSWACRVAARVAHAHVRRDKRDRERPELAAPELRAVRDPDEAPDAYVQRRRLVALLDELPEEQREAVVLHHALGWSVPEIAEQVDAPQETIRSRLRLGMKKLRRLQEEP